MRSKSIDTMNEILDFINKTFFLTREVPSVQEIADKVGIAKSSASRYLAEMETRGLIFKSSTFYGLETQKMRKAMRNTCFMPIVGEIACGTPILAEENIESYQLLSYKEISKLISENKIQDGFTLSTFSKAIAKGLENYVY